MIYETITVHRNGCLRQWRFVFDTNTLHDLITGDTKKSSNQEFEILKSDLRKQGFRFLPYNPNNIAMTPKMRENFRNTFGY